MQGEDKRVADLIDDYQRQGLYGFERAKLETSQASSSAAVGKALARLAEKGRVKRLRKGFYAIVPIEYAAQGLPPSDWYLDALMRSLKLPYYIGLLSATAVGHAGAVPDFRP